MHDTDRTAALPQVGSLREEAMTSLAHPAGRQASQTAIPPKEGQAPGPIQRLMAFIARMFGFKRPKKEILSTLTSERAAIAQAAQLPPPMAFKGDTANTLVTPMGAYAGKPVEQAMHKRAEQQFKNMDVTQATMH